MPYDHPERKHFLVVTRGDEDGGWVEWEVTHHPNCPEEVQYRKPVFSAEGPQQYEPVTHYTCGVGAHVEWYGFDDIEGWQDLPEGEYEIVFYYHSPISMFEDHEAYLEIVE